MKLKQKKFSSWKPKTRSSLRDRKRRKHYKLHTPLYEKPMDYLNQHLDLYDFKKFACRKDYKHNHLTCFDHHNKEDLIRDDIKYSPEKCKSECSNKNCLHSHNDFEKWFHPTMYKKAFCKSVFSSKSSKITLNNEAICPLKDFCPFAHNEEEIRTELLYNYEIDDDFMMFKFKTEPCPLTCIKHDKEKCLFSHDQGDHRRMVVFLSHQPKLCENIDWKKLKKIEDLKDSIRKLVKFGSGFDEQIIQIFKENLRIIDNSSKQGKCEEELKCSGCHNVEEFLYHPSVYKGILCGSGRVEKTCQKNNKYLNMAEEELTFFGDSLSEEGFQNKSDSEETDVNSIEKCTKTHCPHSHEPENYETIQESTEKPFYKFAYNRITPGTFFPGNSFFSNRSENLIYPEDRLLSPPNPAFGFQKKMFSQNSGFNIPHMDPQKMYFKSSQNNWNPNFGAANKENFNFSNFVSPVNMNMYRIQMNNTFLMSNQQGYPRMYMGNEGFSHGINGFPMQGNSGYRQGFYRC